MASTFETNTLAKVKFFLGMKRNQTMKRGCWCSVATSYLSLQEPHGLQQASLLCPSLSPGICSNSCLLLGIPGGSDGKKKKLPIMWETWVWYLGWEDPLKKGSVTPVQYVCLENPMDRGAWKASPWVAKSWTWLSD